MFCIKVKVLHDDFDEAKVVLVGLRAEKLNELDHFMRPSSYKVEIVPK